MATGPNIYLDDDYHPILRASFNDDLDTLRELLEGPDRAKILTCMNWMGCGPLRLAATGTVKKEKICG